MAAWSPFDDSTNGQMLPWRAMGWRQRITAAVFGAFMWGLLFPAFLLAIVAGLGMMIEGVAQQSEHLDRCRRNAATPYEYHECR